MTLDPLATELGKLVLKFVWDGGMKLIDKVGRNANLMIQRASQNYVDRYQKRHGTLKVLGMPEPVKLEGVYTAVNFLDQWSLQSYESVDMLQEAYRERGIQRGLSKQDGLKVANEKQYLMVLGGPGTGKSTFLRRMGLVALKGEKSGYDHRCIPVFVELRNFNTQGIDIEKAISDEFENCRFPDPEEQTKRLLEAGKLLVLLDGLDEVATTRTHEAIRQIQNFVDRYDKNRFIASCRIAAYRGNFRLFTDVAMADFDDNQIQYFINNWFQNAPEVANTCWEKLNDPDHAAAKELTQTPLLLTLVCLLYQRSRKLPSNRATLYERALRVLLEEWAGAKGTPQEDLYKGLDTKRKEMLLAEIAHDAFQQDNLFLTRREISKQIEKILEEMLPNEPVIDGTAVLSNIEVQHGVLVERVEGYYSFSHLTLQEYLTAQYIDDYHQTAQLVRDHLTDERWREVFLLVAGLMRSGADSLLTQMADRAQTLLDIPNLKALVQWADKATVESGGEFKLTVKRIIAILFARTRALDANRQRAVNQISRCYHILASDLSLASSLNDASELDIDRALRIAQEYSNRSVFNSIDFPSLIEQLTSLNSHRLNPFRPETRFPRPLTRELKQIWYTALNLDQSLANLSADEVNRLADYFYAYELILQCRDASVRVSSQVRTEIEARMLTVE